MLLCLCTSLKPSCSTSSKFPLDKDAIILLPSHTEMRKMRGRSRLSSSSLDRHGNTLGQTKKLDKHRLRLVRWPYVHARARAYTQQQDPMWLELTRMRTTRTRSCRYGDAPGYSSLANLTRKIYTLPQRLAYTTK